MNIVEKCIDGFDRLVECVAPVTHARRTAARFATQQAQALLAAHAGADPDRRNWINKSPKNASADADLNEAELDTLRARSRDRMRDDGLAVAAVNAFVDNVVGCGFTPVLRLDHKNLGISEQQARDLETQAEDIWDEWGATCDAAGKLAIEDMQGLLLGSVLVNGDVFSHPVMVKRPGQRFSLKLETLEADRIDTPWGHREFGGRQIRNGVEIGQYGEPVAYWVHVQHPGDAGLFQKPAARKFERFEATNPRTGWPGMFHLFGMERAEQTRGRPILAPILNPLKDRDDLKEAVVVSAQVGACFAAFVKTTDPWGASFANATSDTKGKRIRHQELAPGTIKYLAPGEDITPVQPNIPSSAFEAFLKAITREICSAMGMPYEVASRDFSGTTYSQARASLLEARRMFARRQKWLIRHFLHPIWQMVLEEAWLRGYWPAGADFNLRRHAWTRTYWVPPGWGWIDPEKEVNAYETALRMRITTRQRIVAASEGERWEPIARQIAEEERWLREQGLEPVEQTTKPDAKSKPKGDDDEEGKETEKSEKEETVPA